MDAESKAQRSFRAVEEAKQRAGRKIASGTQNAEVSESVMRGRNEIPCYALLRIWGHLDWLSVDQAQYHQSFASGENKSTALFSVA
jgi:hypothetical protein